MNQELESTLRKAVNKAANDPQFRALCLKSPLEAIGAVSGSNLPAESKFRFVEKQVGETIIILPPALEQGGEVTDEQLLDGVSGGVGKNIFWYS